MKTIAELYQEIVNNEELKQKFAAMDINSLVEWVKAQGVDASLEELQSFIQSQTTGRNELNDNELDQVAGGKGLGQILGLSGRGNAIACNVARMASNASDSMKDAVCDRLSTK